MSPTGLLLRYHTLFYLAYLREQSDWPIVKTFLKFIAVLHGDWPAPSGCLVWNRISRDILGRETRPTRLTGSLSDASFMHGENA